MSTRTRAFVAAAILCTCTSASATPSKTWGKNGELFDPRGRLMDWSYAGYRHGEAALPTPPVKVDVTQHGASPNDAGDDTAAFKKAIAVAAGGGVVLVPAGTYIIKDKLVLTNGVVLRGAGRQATVLDIPVSLTDLYGNPGLDGGGQSTYSFSQGFIEARGKMSTTRLATVTAKAGRGDTLLAVSTTTGLSAGQWVRLEQTDVAGKLIDRMHADLMAGGSDNVGDKWTFHTRIKAVKSGAVELERPLPLDVDTAWSPGLYPFSPTVSEVGVEHLTVRFAVTAYPGHFKEQGYNAIYFQSVANAWVRDVTISNADYGVNVNNSHFVTISGVVLDTTGNRGPLVGHHGLNNSWGADNLYIDFDVQTTFVHDLTNEWYATGVVFTRGRGKDLRMDHHRAAPYTTLWAEIDAGAGTQPFFSGGSSNRGPHTAAYNTLWNVRAAAAMGLPPSDFGPRMSFIGFQTNATSATSPYDWWLESIPPAQLEPANIWEAMRRRRLGASTTGDAASARDGTTTNDGGNRSDAAPTLDLVSDKRGAADAGGLNRAQGGCGCTVSGGSLSGPLLGLALLLLAMARRRRSWR